MLPSPIISSFSTGNESVSDKDGVMSFETATFQQVVAHNEKLVCLKNVFATSQACKANPKAHSHFILLYLLPQATYIVYEICFGFPHFCFHIQAVYTPGVYIIFRMSIVTQMSMMYTRHNLILDFLTAELVLEIIMIETRILFVLEKLLESVQPKICQVYIS